LNVMVMETDLLHVYLIVFIFSLLWKALWFQCQEFYKKIFIHLCLVLKGPMFNCMLGWEISTYINQSKEARCGDAIPTIGRLRQKDWKISRPTVGFIARPWLRIKTNKTKKWKQRENNGKDCKMKLQVK
jgi:hypothetical protein